MNRAQKCPCPAANRSIQRLSRKGEPFCHFGATRVLEGSKCSKSEHFCCDSEQNAPIWSIDAVNRTNDGVNQSNDATEWLIHGVNRSNNAPNQSNVAVNRTIAGDRTLDAGRERNMSGVETAVDAPLVLLQVRADIAAQVALLTRFAGGSPPPRLPGTIAGCGWPVQWSVRKVRKS